MKRNQVVKKVGTQVFLVENAETPTDLEWQEFLDILRAHPDDLPKLKILILTAGGSPNSTQRKKLQATLGNVRFPVAVVSDSINVRFVASIIALFHRDHRSFAIAEISRAYEHLRLSAAERTLAQTTIKEMQTLID